MADSGRHAVSGPRWWSVALFWLAGTASAGGLVVALLTVLVARKVVTPPRGHVEEVRILSVDTLAGTITLLSSLDARLPGRYGLWFSINSGHARLGEIVEQTPHTVTRRLLGTDFGDLDRATRGHFSGWFFLTPRDLGHPFETVLLETALGPAPAWLIPPESPTTRWVVQVHGRGVKRSETLRAVDVFRRAGYNSLLISWRNDGDAPASLDKRYALGNAEWLDVEAGIRFALAGGATDVVLMGWSMGGATVLQAVSRSPLSSAVRGVILESPVVAWAPILDFQAQRAGVPRLVRRAVLGLIGSRRIHRLTGQGAPIDFAALDFVRRNAELSVPILLMHSDDDDYVPSTASLALAEVRPDIVTYSRWRGARHTKLWNYDPARFDREISEWLATLPMTGRASDRVEPPG